MGETILLVILQMFMLVGGQIIWKTGVSKIGVIQLNNIHLLISSWYFWAGVCIYGLATVLWMVILSRANLSTVYPLQSFAYVFGAIAGIIIFGENVSTVGWVGLALIILGVFLTSSGLR